VATTVRTILTYSGRAGTVTAMSDTTDAYSIGVIVAEMDLLIESRQAGDWSIVDVKGEVDLYSAPRLKDRLGELTAAGRDHIAVDLAGVEFLDSTGLGVLIGALKRCREAGGILALAAPRDPVRKVLAITGLDRVFPVHDTVEQVTSS
jgi:anti-sigma B factor antagonist